jgi:GNAT superfamily N-acetyltransferase
LNHDINNASRQFVAFIDDEPVALDSCLHMPHPIAKNIKRKHRLVVRPDFQGIGIGSRLSDFVADKLRKEGFRVTSTTTSPALIFARKRNPRWKLKFKGKQACLNKSSTISNTTGGRGSSRRMTTVWEFI